MVDSRAQYSAASPQPDDILDICRRSADGDPDARRRLMELLFDRIHKTASYMTGNRQDATDIAQSACIEVLLSAGSYRGEASITYWADRVTLQTAAKLFTKRTRRQKIRETYFQPPPSAMGAEETAGRAQVRQRLADLLQTLKLTHREVVLLRYIHGYTIKEAAALCDVPVETARGRLKKGRAVLKKKVLADPLLKQWIREWIEQ